MFLERVSLTNFQCFGPEPTTIRFDTQLTAMLGGNAAGKTPARPGALAPVQCRR